MRARIISKDGRLFGYTAKERLLNYSVLNNTNGCLEWIGYIMRNGYGQFYYHGKKYAHRVSYEIHKGEIPANVDVCHSCDNRKCINPEHLFLGTRKENIQDCIKKARFMSPKRLDAQKMLWTVRKANNPIFEPKHPSLTAYTKYKCRCEPCRKLFSDYQRQRKLAVILNGNK